MAATGPAFGRGPFLNSCLKSLSTKLGRQPWKSLGAASALTLGLSLTISKSPASGDKSGALQIMDGLITHWPNALNCVTSFASLSSSFGKEFVEPSTGVVFPEVLSEGERITGIGLRKKSIIGLKNITVYAYGVYADPDSFKSTLGTKYENFTPEELSSKEELFTDVSKSDVGLTIRLVIVYGRLKIGTIRNAFGTSLRKLSDTGNKALLDRFTSLFTDDLKLPKGTIIDITRLPGHVLRTTIEGQEVGSVQSSLLCQAVFDLYIGENAFDKPARKAMGVGFASILSGQESDLSD